MHVGGWLVWGVRWGVEEWGWIDRERVHRERETETLRDGEMERKKLEIADIFICERLP